MKLTRRRLLIASAVAVAVIGGAWFTVAEQGPPFGVTWSAYHGIRFGMTIDEVNQIVGHPGEPPEWRIPRGGAMVFESDEDLRSGLAELADVTEWDDGRENLLSVGFTKDGLVCEKRFCYQPMLDKLLRQLQYFWGKLGF